MMVRQQLVLPGDGGWLTVVIDEPPDPVGLVVVAHDLLSDRTGPGDRSATLAAALADAALACVRFDFTGAGDSAGALRASTWDGMRQNLERVYLWAAARHGRLPTVLIGHGIGAVPTLEAAAVVPDCRGVVLLDSDLLQDVRYVIEGSVVIKGGRWHLPEVFFRERESLRPRTAAVDCRMPVVLAYGAQDAKASAGVGLVAGSAIRTVPLPGEFPFRSGGPATIRAVAGLVIELLPGTERPSY